LGKTKQNLFSEKKNKKLFLEGIKKRKKR